MSLAFPLTSHMQFAIENKIERTLAEQDILRQRRKFGGSHKSLSAPCLMRSAA
jgi:hypothetical protein